MKKLVIAAIVGLVGYELWRMYKQTQAEHQALEKQPDPPRAQAPAGQTAQ